MPIKYNTQKGQKIHYVILNFEGNPRTSTSRAIQQSLI